MSESYALAQQHAQQARTAYGQALLSYEATEQLRSDLDALQGTRMLSESETLTLMMLERRAEQQASLLPDLERNAALSSRIVDTEQLVDDWAQTVPAKASAYEGVLQALVALQAAVTTLRQVHVQQEHLIERLDPQIRERFNFPSTATLLSNLQSRLGPVGAALTAIGIFTQGQWRQTTDADPGLRPLNDRTVSRYLSELKQRMQHAWSRTAPAYETD